MVVFQPRPSELTCISSTPVTLSEKVLLFAFSFHVEPVHISLLPSNGKEQFFPTVTFQDGEGGEWHRRSAGVAGLHS